MPKFVRHACATLFAFSVLLVFASNEVTDANWRNHPKIVEIRKLYENINKLEDEGAYLQAEQSCPLGHGRFRRDASVLYTENKVVRKYRLYSTKEETGEDVESYYDEKGVLRFVLVRCDDRNVGSVTVRTYFDANGKLLYNHKKIEGEPEYCVDTDAAITHPIRHYKNYCFGRDL